MKEEVSIQLESTGLGRCLRALDRSWVCVAIVAIPYIAYLVLRLSVNAWDPSHFIVAGDHFVSVDQTPTKIEVQDGSDGYDGQFYYRLALEPLPHQRTRFGVTIDNPSYRSQRIFYPFLAYILSIGNKGWVPLILILVNLVGILAVAGLAGSLVASYGFHRIAGTAVAFYPGFLLSLSRDLTEPVAIALVLASLVMLKGRHYLGAALALSLAVLTRETALLVAVLASMVWLYELVKRRTPRTIQWQVFVIPLTVYAGWQLVLHSVWGRFPLAAGGNNIGPPFKGAVDVWRMFAQLSLSARAHWLIEVALVTAVSIVALLCLKRTRLSVVGRSAFVGYLLVGIGLSSVVWIEDWAFLRALSEAFVFGWLIIAITRLRLKAVLAVATLGVWLSLAALNVRG
ncbi:MAG: AZOBR_p60025 family cell surface glycopolymer formation protein [Actinomycetota bacterium]|nr:hypothetical protein [Actinomycetota bacterium]